ncbi:ankyrin, partial [Colletotrichum falcatum]
LNGASPDVPDDRGWRPLHFAAWSGHAEVVRLLLQAGASAEMPTSRFTHKYRSHTITLYYEGAWAGTPLHLAAMAGNAETTRLILQENVDVEARTDSLESGAGDARGREPWTGGPTALHMALNTGRDNFPPKEWLSKGRLEIAWMLVERGASVEGVANHLRLQDVVNSFGEFPELWDKLRAGITVE